MQEKDPRERRVPYTGRFADPAQISAARRRTVAQPRPEGARTDDAVERPRTAGVRGADSQQRRPSGFAAPEAAKRRPAPAPRASEEDASRENAPQRGKRFRKRKADGGDGSPNKRSQVKKRSWKKRLLIIMILLLALFALFVLIFGREDKTYHQLPRIERGGDSAYEPEQSTAPEGGAASEEIDWSQYLVTPEPTPDQSGEAGEAGEADEAAAEGEEAPAEPDADAEGAEAPAEPDANAEGEEAPAELDADAEGAEAPTEPEAPAEEGA